MTKFDALLSKEYVFQGDLWSKLVYDISSVTIYQISPIQTGPEVVHFYFV